MKYDVIIIGAGLGGLECGVILSRQGMSVLVLEQQHQPGGCMQSYSRGGEMYDTGLHYVGGLDEGQPLHQAFTYLGLLQLPWQRLDPSGFDIITIADETLPMVEGYDAFRDAFADRFPHERAGLQTYVDMLRHTNETSLTPLLQPQQPHTMPADFTMGAYSWMRQTFSDNLLINFLAGNSLRMELRKDTLPLYTFAHCNAPYITSSWRLKGHGNMLVQRLVDQIKANGGEVLCDNHVSELHTTNGHITTATCTGGAVYEATTYISSLHPATTVGLITDHDAIKKTYRRRMTTLHNTYGFFTVSLHLKPHTIPYMNHNRYIYSHANVWDISQAPHSSHAMLISCPYSGSPYATHLDLLTPMTWDECLPWTGTTPGHRGKDYTDFKRRKAEGMIDIASRYITGLKDAAEHVYTSTPLTYRDYNGAVDGNAYGIRKDCNDPLMTLLTPRTPLPNLLLTGQSLMVHGIQGTTMTALHTCAEIRRIMENESRS